MYPGDSEGGAAEVVNCRCALLQRARAALDESELETLKERAAYFGLDKTGSFWEYKKKYLKAVEEYYDNNELSAFKNSIKKIKNKTDILTRNKPPVPLNKLKTPYADSISETINNAPPLFNSLIVDNGENILFAKTNAMGIAKHNKKYGIFINLDKDFLNSRGRWTTLFHEVGHNIDKIYGLPSESLILVNALKDDFLEFTETYSQLYNINIDEAYTDISKILLSGNDEEMHIISDLFDALSNGKCYGKWRHNAEYWASDKIIAHEAFAHFFSATTINKTASLQMIKEAFPNAYKVFLQIIGEM